MADLCELDDVKAWLGITDTNSDGLLTRLISAVSQEFINETRRKDLTPAAEYTDFLFDGHGHGLRYWLYDGYAHWQETSRQEIFLPHYPINSITSVSLNGIDLDEVTDLDDTSQVGWFFDDANLIDEDRSKILLVGYSFLYTGCGSRLKVESNAGYSTIPADIQQACIEWVAFLRGQSQLQSADQSAGGERIGNYERLNSVASDTRAVLTLELPTSIQSVIDKYRRPETF